MSFTSPASSNPSAAFSRYQEIAKQQESQEAATFTIFSNAASRVTLNKENLPSKTWLSHTWSCLSAFFTLRDKGSETIASQNKSVKENFLSSIEEHYNQLTPGSGTTICAALKQNTSFGLSNDKITTSLSSHTIKLALEGSFQEYTNKYGVDL